MPTVHAAQTFNLQVVSNANGTIVASALSYWQTLSPNGGGVAVGLIVEVCISPYNTMQSGTSQRLNPDDVLTL